MTHKQKTTFIYTAPAVILSIPFVVNFFSDEVNWSSGDFLIMGILLFGTAIIIDLIIRKAKTETQKIIFSCLILTVLILTWIELAVGIFGSPFAGN